MYTLFNQPIVFNPALNKVTGWNETRRNVLEEMNRLAKFYHYTAQWSRNTNVINRILDTLDVSPNKDKDYVAQLAREEFAPKIGLFGLFSSTITFRIQPLAQFYNQSCLEVLIYDDSYFDANKAKGNWQQLEPIKVLDHPFDDINLSIPNFDYQSSGNNSGLVFISINVAMLVVQYHYWVESLTEAVPDITTAKAQFIMRYPIFNTIKSHMDISIRNRFFKLYSNEPVSNFLKVHPVMLRDYSRLLDNALRNVCATIRDRSLTYNELLQQIPAVSYENQLQVLKLPEITPTRPVKWALDLTRIRTIHNLLRYEDEKKTGSLIKANLNTSTSPRNLHTRAFIKRKLISMKGSQAIPIALDLATTEMIASVEDYLQTTNQSLV